MGQGIVKRVGEIKVNRIMRNRHILVTDVLSCIIAYMLAIVIVFPIAELRVHFMESVMLVLVTAAIYICVAAFFGVYRMDWVYAGAKEYFFLIVAFGVSAVLSVFVGILLEGVAIYPKLNVAANFFAIAFMCFVRFAVRLIYRGNMLNAKKKGTRVLVVGAGSLAVMLLRDIAENKRINYNVIGLIDDDPAKQKKRIYNSCVIGTRYDIEKICSKEKIEEIIFAIYDTSSKNKAELLDICSRTGLKVKIIPGVEAALTGELNLKKIREVEIEDLLEREPIKLNNKLIGEDLLGKTVLVTGGGGSIGSELCRQIVKFQPKKLIILDIYENTTYELQNELEEKYPNQKLEVLIASVRDKKRLNAIFSEQKPHIVFHAAAHKHVPLMEFSPCEAIKNNVFGTYNTAQCAIENGVEKFVLISTDKAVNPTNIMGATKRMCEMIVQTLERENKTEFVAVRFGNVLGSNGSVIPRFRKQIQQGGPVTVTHPEITRFFMTIPEAAQLVLQAAAYAKGGEIFVLDMGEPVKIYNLAKKMIALSGLKEGEDIEIKITGLREGEKLYEELLMAEEGLEKTAHSKIYVGQPLNINKEELEEKLSKLESVIEKGIDEVKEIMSEVVPTYKPIN